MLNRMVGFELKYCVLCIDILKAWCYGVCSEVGDDSPGEG